MKPLKELTDTQRIELFKLVFINNHSRGFMTSEIKDMFASEKDVPLHDHYRFGEPIVKNWKEVILEYLNKNGFEAPKTSLFNLNG